MILPGMNGSQILAALRAINPQVKVVISSGYSLQGDVQELMKTGCRGFIQKPYTIKTLSELIRQAIRD